MKRIIARLTFFLAFWSDFSSKVFQYRRTQIQATQIDILLILYKDIDFSLKLIPIWTADLNFNNFRDNSSELIYMKRKNSCHTGTYYCYNCPITLKHLGLFWYKNTTTKSILHLTFPLIENIGFHILILIIHPLLNLKPSVVYIWLIRYLNDGHNCPFI